MAPPVRPIAERFWEKVDKSDKCWLWTAYRDRDGYGKFWFIDRQDIASRVAYILKDRNSKHRQAIGERHGRAKLTEIQVRDILSKLKQGESKMNLAREFKVTPASVYFIASGKNWGWIK